MAGAAFFSANTEPSEPPKVPVARYLALLQKLMNAEKKLKECKQGGYAPFAEDPGAAVKIGELEAEIAMLKQKLREFEEQFSPYEDFKP